LNQAQIENFEAQEASIKILKLRSQQLEEFSPVLERINRKRLGCERLEDLLEHPFLKHNY